MDNEKWTSVLKNNPVKDGVYYAYTVNFMTGLGEITELKYKECFKWYQNNKELLKHYGHASQCFSAIDCELEEYERTKEVYKTITDASMEAYLHSDHPIGLTEITDFLVIGYKESYITLSDIEHANKYDVLSAVEDSDYNLIKEKALEI